MARVLVVDDAEFIRKAITMALADGGHEVVGEAEDGESAVARYRELRPDLTTLDITMPIADGMAALKGILSFDPSARVVMCSAVGQEHKVVESISIGARDFIVKPLQRERLLSVIERALA